VPITEIKGSDAERIRTGISELDRTLGGGIVRGSTILIGGDPGIGKSTLMLQVAGRLASGGSVCLYISAEESSSQLRMRAERIGVSFSSLLVMAETSLEVVLEKIKHIKPELVILDSIQTVYSTYMESPPGSISQIREVTGRMLYLAKGMGIPVFMVGHVTKEGTIAGPKAVEHMVDVVLYFEGERNYPYRILRAIKNRFGSTNEIGIFEMRENGLEEVKNPSEFFLSERPQNASGSVVVAAMEGTRSILVEIQALLTQSPYGMPRRTTIGIDPNRVSLIVAVLERKAGFPLFQHDVFIKITGGVKIDEPAVDLGIVGAAASSFLDKPIPADTVVFGEIGLAGEIRGVIRGEMRIKEASKMGFRKCIIPASNRKALRYEGDMEIIDVSNIKEFIHLVFGGI
ncbi:MAG: DNA repair protein RadA, partial [Candidatus Aenigmatarchaeota archaeon]